jgi:hypothetical protein
LRVFQSQKCVAGVQRNARDQNQGRRNFVAGAVHSRRAGESFFVPRGTNHTFKVTSAEPCHHLTILTPGGFEGFFAEMAKGQFRIPEDMAKIAEIGAAYNLSLTGPPL